MRLRVVPPTTAKGLAGLAVAQAIARAMRSRPSSPGGRGACDPAPVDPRRPLNLSGGAAAPLDFAD